MILYPTLVDGAAPAPELFNAAPATDWPLILDVDEVTADAPPACCWPALDGPPPATFAERWLAMPSTWILASMHE
jgi:hypothetical protein